ncbi:conserved hypothetical protein distantly related to alpha-glycosyltransferases family 4 [Synechococcus sp. BOUM118]|nr:conserved hypothetical protein distantly related to alpha-glycosyltransferases family 4 [Synechococcus sp. BOUM118]
MTDILVVSPYDTPIGPSTRSYDIATYLAAKYKVNFLCSNFCHFTRSYIDISSFSKSNLKLHVCLVTPYKTQLGRYISSIVYLVQIIFHILFRKPSLVITPSVPLYLSFFIVIACKFTSASTIFEIRDIWPLSLSQLSNLSTKSFLYRILDCMEKFIYTHCTHIVSSLSHAHLHVASCIPPNLLPPITFIPNPISQKLLDYSLQKSVPNKSQSSDFNQIVYIGGFGIVHDVHTLLHASSYYLQHFDPTAQFHFYGNGEKKQEIINLSHSFPSSEGIIFHDFIPKSEALKVACQADVLIAAIPNRSIFDYGINLNKIYLYLCAGKPIAFAGNIPYDFISEYLLGKTSPAEDHILLAESIHSLIVDPIPRQCLLNSGQNYINLNLSPSIICDRYLNIVDSVLEKK